MAIKKLIVQNFTEREDSNKSKQIPNNSKFMLL
jgi:hypothetical protein